jgi:hypothetical protein
MKKALAGSAVTALAAAAFLFLYSAPTAGQGQQGQPEPAGINPAGGGVPMASLERLKTKASGPAPRAADGKPDLSGIWGPESHLIGDIAAALKPGDKLPLQPWALKLTRARLSKDDPNASCLPSGIPRQSPFPFKIIQTPKEIVFLVEGNVHTYRQVFMDGIGHPHTEKLHVIERYRRSDAGHLDYEITIDDPGAYTRPFTLYGHSPLLQNTEIMEYFCIENNQDVAHILGKGTPARE